MRALFSTAVKASLRRAGTTEAPELTRKVTAICAPDGFDLKRIAQCLPQKYTLQPELSSDVLHFRTKSDIFVFADGSVVSWDKGEAACEQLLLELKKIYPNIKETEVEEMCYKELESGSTRLADDVIVIGGDAGQERTLAKLSFSHALCRSAQVSFLENRLDRFVDSVKDIPKLLANGTSPKLSRLEIFRKIGELLCIRAQLNLTGRVESLLDTPDYYWSRPNLEEYFMSASRWLDIEPRISVLNRKLDYAAECVEVLRADHSERHGLKLEWGIIALIAVEVVFEFVHYFERHSM